MKKPKLKLVGSDGNAFVIVGKAKKAARRVGWSKAEIEGMMQEARSGDYPLQRLQVRAHPVVLDDEDGPEIYNWRKSPMEQ